MHNTFHLSYTILNDSDLPIDVRCKGGLSYTVAKNDSPPLNTSQRINVKISNLDLRMFRLDPNQAVSKFDKALMRSLNDAAQREQSPALGMGMGVYNQTLNVYVALERSVMESNGCIYSDFLGVTVYCGSNINNLVAMNTPLETLGALERVQDPEASVATSIMLIDPERRFGTLWTNTLGKAKMIIHTPNTDKQPGLYLVNGGSGSTKETDYFKLEELDDKILRANGIFHTERLAMEGANTEALIKVEKKVEELEKENSNLTKAFEKQTLTVCKLESKIVASQTELAQTKHTTSIKEMFNKQELFMLKSKSSYDDFGNIIKNTTALLSLGTLIYKLLT